MPMSEPASPHARARVFAHSAEGERAAAISQKHLFVIERIAWPRYTSEMGHPTVVEATAAVSVERDRLAFRNGADTLTYGELVTKADALAAELANRTANGKLDRALIAELSAVEET
ncbi:MAG: hypothetical protein JWO36_5450 [Myxococcales bacterium]|nr:hypothetical protein [Myxococcales bacterium]